MPLRRALLSVHDKTGIVDLARALASRGVELLSTGGTARHLTEAGLEVTSIDSLVGFPHLLGGRVKTLAPQVHGGILARRDEPAHIEELEREGIAPIDLVAVTLYPFETALREGKDLEALIEEVDIGGVTLLRAAAKNHQDVVVLSGEEHYGLVQDALEREGEVSLALRRRLAFDAFQRTSRYDALIARGLGARFETGGIVLDPFPEAFPLPLRKSQTLRYGENHHQEAAFYHDLDPRAIDEVGLANARQLHGKELSYNNILDGDVALNAAREFPDPTVVIVKHATPSGIASADTLLTAWEHAYATDTYSPFGGIIAVNRTLDGSAAGAMKGIFLEMVLAPAFSVEARDILMKKKNLRLIEVPGMERHVQTDLQDHAPRGRRLTYRSVSGGLLVQDRDLRPFTPDDWEVVTKRRPSKEEYDTMLFAARVVKHVRSNAVVFAKGTRTVGIGGGQTARVDASTIAVHKGGDNIRGSIMASDAFFPFRDAVDVAAEAGVTAIVQPGGSIRDAEVFAAADEHDIAMVTTRHRLFHH
ncbi:MAG: bifunctional phosphoribosylaminoimidazolecarboxamide formyltransferase/IMP cyclohydrolase [Euryarchaeota archaeon]|nr:bifunctional phosphoribosylaminoimidazolecarboxamide formyltransferase/IMP cyclohydrolase [Euryarchaeota archaeon]